LIAEYAQAFDHHDEALLRSIWHEVPLLSLGDAFGNFEGVEAILESARQPELSMPTMQDQNSASRSYAPKATSMLTPATQA
jgi:predicted DNA repair protein MutK